MVLECVVNKLTEDDVTRAEAYWAAYQSAHDLKDREGQTAGIDPSTGRVWFGDTITDVTSARAKEGLSNPLYFVRVGLDYYYRKGGRP